MKISSFYYSVTKIMIIYYTLPEIWCVTDVIVIFHFGLFFGGPLWGGGGLIPLCTLTAHKIKMKKKMKKHLDISSFYIYVPKIMIKLC